MGKRREGKSDERLLVLNNTLAFSKPLTFHSLVRLFDFVDLMHYLGRGTSMEKMPPLDGQVDKSVGHFLDEWVVWEGPGQWGQNHYWANKWSWVVKGIVWNKQGKEESKQHLFLHGLCVSSCPGFLLRCRNVGEINPASQVAFVLVFYLDSEKS